MAVGVVLGLVVGSWLDKRFGWTPWGVLVGTMLGMASGMYLLIRDGLRVNKD
jgi:F0F1-type ATP synthase assembly protein I